MARAGKSISEVARRSGLLRGLCEKTGQFLGLMRESFHLLARELTLNVDGLFEVFRMNEALSKLEIRLEVGFRILYGLFVELTGARGEHVGRLGHNVLSLAGGLKEAVVSFASLVDALAGDVAHGGRNFKVYWLIYSGLSFMDFILGR